MQTKLTLTFFFPPENQNYRTGWETYKASNCEYYDDEFTIVLKTVLAQRL